LTVAFAQFDVVDGRGGSVLDGTSVLRAIEAAHAGVGLRPNDEIQRDEAELCGSSTPDQPRVGPGGR
jgi:hypothetical protein